MKVPTRGPVLAGALVLFAALLVLGTVFTPAPHTGGDNASYLTLGHSLATGAGYLELWDPATPPHTKYPPVFPAALALLSLLGASSWVAFKLLSLFALAGAVLFVYLWGRDRRGPVVGAAIALLTLLSAGWLDAGRWILSEPLFLFLTFAALWAVERGVGRLPVWGVRLGPARDEADSNSPLPPWGWAAVAGAGAILAFFTRSAGLPLVLALLVLLFATGAWKRGLVVVGAFALLAGAWFLRARTGVGAGAYQSEFWMVNPYEPALGTIGWLDLPLRAWTNLRLYGGEVLGAQWWGGMGSAALLGIVLALLALWGWTLRVRLGAGVTELFLPLYLGLILLWPEVWSGARFILPLTPILLLYAGDAVRYAGRPLGRVGGPALLAASTLLLALPAVPGWLDLAEEGGECRRIAEGGDPFRCHPASVQEFRVAAAWTGANLPEGAVVLNRKPSIFYILGGTRGAIFPFTPEPDPFLAEADRLGAEYLLFDTLDGISLYYIPLLIQARPLAFCHIGGWGGSDQFPGTELFGILPPEERRVDAGMENLATCPSRYTRAEAVTPPIEGARIPLFLPGRGALQSSAAGSP